MKLQFPQDSLIDRRWRLSYRSANRGVICGRKADAYICSNSGFFRFAFYREPDVGASIIASP